MQRPPNVRSLLMVSALICIFNGPSYADCPGCGPGYGGVIKCREGTALSPTCAENGCSVCAATSALAASTSLATSVTTGSTISNGSADPSGTTKIFLAAASPQATDTAQVVFPHVVDGGGFKTVLLLTNGTDTNTTATVSFVSDTGAPLSVTVGGTAASSFLVPIQAWGSAKLTTSGNSSATVQGWALVTTAPPVTLNGNEIFQLFNGSSLFSEAAVPAAPASNSVDFYDDEEDGFITGLAVANPGSVTASGTLTLRNTSGVAVGTHPIEVRPRGHSSTFLYQIIPGATSGRADINLTAGALSVTALRFHTSLVFSTVSVGQTGGLTAPISALFSPNGGVRARIISEISKAISSVDIAIYSFTADEIRDALIAAKNRGVAIRIIADASQATGQGSDIAALEQQGFNLKRTEGLSGGIMHNKYMIIDGKTLFTGSYNWSASAEDRNFENALFVQGSSVIQSYISDFDTIWNR
jgi:hypothetical protein